MTAAVLPPIFAFAPAPKLAALPAPRVHTVKGTSRVTVLEPRRPGPPRRVSDALEFPKVVTLTGFHVRRAAAFLREVGLHKGDLWPGAKTTDSVFSLDDPLGPFDYPSPSHQFYEHGDPVCGWGALLVTNGWGSAPLRWSLEQMLVDPHGMLEGLARINDGPRTSAESVARWMEGAAGRMEVVKTRRW